MRSFEYRLYPTKKQQVLLSACLENSRLLYNEMLELNIARYEEEEKFIFRDELCKMFAGRGGESVPQSTVQTLATRLDKALKAMIKRKKKGEKGGFPRFKGYLGWHSFQLRKYGKSCDVYLDGNKLHVPRKLGGPIKVKVHRPLEGTPKTAYIVRRVDKWYVVIPCEVDSLSVPPREYNPVGIDVGVKSFLTDSNNNVVANPRYRQRSQNKLRRQQRRAARRTKGSNRRRKANIQVSKTHQHIARQRRDFHFKVAKIYADQHDSIFVENLNIEGLVKNKKLSKYISDAAWGQFLDILTDKAERAGGRVVRVDPKYTSQLCSKCGEIVQKSLSVRTHICSECGFIADRDHNAAINILKRGLSPQGHCGQALTYENTHCVA